MVEGLTVMIITTLVVLSIAIAVVVGLALIRRPAHSWQVHLREQNQGLRAERGHSETVDKVNLRATTLSRLLNDAPIRQTAYLNADILPGIGRIEVVTDRIEALHERRRQSNS